MTSKPVEQIQETFWRLPAKSRSVFHVSSNSGSIKLPREKELQCMKALVFLEVHFAFESQYEFNTYS